MLDAASNTRKMTTKSVFGRDKIIMAQIVLHAQFHKLSEVWKLKNMQWHGVTTLKAGQVSLPHDLQDWN